MPRCVKHGDLQPADIECRAFSQTRFRRAAPEYVVSGIKSRLLCKRQRDRLFVTARNDIGAKWRSMHEAADPLVHVGGRSSVIGVVMGEQEAANLGWVDPILFDVTENLICLAVRTADAGIDQRELITAVDDVQMAIKWVGDIE